MVLKKFQQYIFLLHCTSLESDTSITCRPQYIRQHTKFCINDFKIVLTTHDIAWAVGTVFCEAYCQIFHFCYSGMKLWQFSTSLYWKLTFYILTKCKNQCMSRQRNTKMPVIWKQGYLQSCFISLAKYPKSGSLSDPSRLLDDENLTKTKDFWDFVISVLQKIRDTLMSLSYFIFCCVQTNQKTRTLNNS